VHRPDRHCGKRQHAEPDDQQSDVLVTPTQNQSGSGRKDPDSELEGNSGVCRGQEEIEQRCLGRVAFAGANRHRQPVLYGGQGT